MPIIIKKLNQREKNGALIKRFTNAFNNARMLDKARSIMFRVKKPSKNMQKRIKMRRLKLKAHYDHLEKIGKGQQRRY